MRTPFLPTLIIAAALGSTFAPGCKSPPGPTAPTILPTAPTILPTDPTILPGGPTQGPPPADGAAPPAPPGKESGQPGKTEPPSPHDSAPAPAVRVPLSPACEAMLARLRELDTSVPIVFAYSGRSTAEINEEVKEGIALARRFLAGCPGEEPACEVKAQLARFLLARERRHSDEMEKERHQALKDSGMSAEALEAAWPGERARIDEEMRAYHDEVRSLSAATAGCKDSSRGRLTGIFVTLKLAEQEGRHEEVRRLARTFLEEGGESPAAPSVHLSVASSYLAERRYKEAVEYLRAVIDKRENDPELVVFIDRLFDALTGLGDLEGMEELAHRVRAEFPGRMESIPGQFLKSVYEQWYYNALFWIGYVRMAMGDVDGAKSAFRESIAEVEALEARLKAEGKLMNNVIKIYLDNRTRDLLDYLEVRHGTSPMAMDDGAARPLDFDLGSFWATDEKCTLAESRGKVVAAVFQTKGFHDSRSRPFLVEIDRLVKEREKDGLRGVWLSFLTGKGGAEEDRKALETLREERKALGVSLPAGYDPDRSAQRLFRNLNATVGSSTFFVFDRKGRYAWYMSDPRGIDLAITRRVIERILAEKE